MPILALRAFRFTLNYPANVGDEWQSSISVISQTLQLLSRFRSFFSLSHGTVFPENGYLMKDRSLTYIRPVGEALLLASGPDEIRPLPPYHPRGLCDPVLYQAYGKGGEPVFSSCVTRCIGRVPRKIYWLILFAICYQ